MEAAMPDRREALGLEVAATLGRLNRAELRGELVAGLIDAGLLARLRRLRVVRPDDLLVLDFELDNLVPRSGRLVRNDSSRPGLLIVSHQPQAIAEHAFLDMGGQGSEYGTDDNNGKSKPALLPAAARASGPSRVVFSMPAGDEVPYTLDGLLDACRRWPLHLAWTAQPPPEAESSGTRWIADVGGLREQVAALGEVLAAAVASQYGQARVAELQRSGRKLGEGLATPESAVLRGGRMAFQRQVATATARLRPARDMEDTGAARAFVEVVAAGALLDMRPVPGVFEKMPELWPYLLKPSAPSRDRTAIELPYRLVGSPLPGTGFTHAVAPVEHGGRTELWHSRMGLRQGSDVDDTATLPLRYLWSPDYEQPAGRQVARAFNGALDKLDRRMIVKLTAGYDGKLASDPARFFTPRPVDVHRLHLSALGGSLDLDKSWRQRPEGLDMEAWVHRAHLARDHYVRVEYAGFLYPFGHAATLVKVSERKFEKVEGYGAVAPLRQRYFVIVRDRVRRFAGDPAMPDGGRSLPFTAIECLTAITPDLQQPGSQSRDRLGSAPSPLYAQALEYRMAFWPSLMAGGQNLQFQFVGIDHAGRRIPFQCPAMFISELRNTPASLATIAEHYRNEGPRRTPSLQGASVRLAPDPEGGTDVDVPLEDLCLEPRAEAVSQAYGLARFFPGMEQARARLPALERLAGMRHGAVVRYPQVYREHGFDLGQNAGQVFAALESGVVDFGGASRGDATGGVASPGIVPTALSKAFGLGSGDLQSLAGNQFDPASFFADDAAKLLGFIPLRLLLEKASFSAPSGAPRLDTRVLDDGSIQTRLWLEKKKLKPPAGLDDLLLVNAGGDSVLRLESTNRAWLDPSRPPESVADGELTHFKVNLFGAIVLWFQRLHFNARNGHKPEVDVDLHKDHGVTFGGPLEFVNALKDLIPGNGFSDPPALAVTPQGITASFSLGLPNVQVGVLALSNINLGASFNLPFTGERPSLRFNFAERHNTFNLTVSLFGGGGFFAIGVDTGGVHEIEAALEFGASIQIDLGVASGSVYVKGGFYFHFEEDNVLFQGYVEMGGRLRIIGLISVSLTFHLSLAYESRQQGTKPGGLPRKVSTLHGQASLVVEVEVLFFSASVEVKVRREFAGSEADPTFADFIPSQRTWDDYCLAFA
jgi:hypothetical protein